MGKERFVITETINLKNGKKFIGTAVLSGAEGEVLEISGSGTYWENALKKYGKEAFRIKEIEVCDSMQEMLNREEALLTDGVLKNPEYYNIHRAFIEEK